MVKKVKQAGYSKLESWDGIVKEIEGLFYVENGFRWYWIRYG